MHVILQKTTYIKTLLKEIKLLISDLRKKYKDIDKNIFHSFHNVNLNTIIGYHTDSIQYHFLDDYDLKKQNH